VDEETHQRGESPQCSTGAISTVVDLGHKHQCRLDLGDKDDTITCRAPQREVRSQVLARATNYMPPLETLVT
jgi:hypothetical protein